MVSDNQPAPRFVELLHSFQEVFTDVPFMFVGTCISARRGVLICITLPKRGKRLKNGMTLDFPAVGKRVADWLCIPDACPSAPPSWNAFRHSGGIATLAGIVRENV